MSPKPTLHPGMTGVPTGRRKPAARPQRGAALLTAMVIVTLVATLAAGMVWQQWRAVQVEAAERSRAQAHWILGGAVDWARLILREDAITGGADHLGEPWAVPLAEAKLSTFLAADRENTEDAPEAFLSGSITDAQSRYNLRNLAESGPAALAEERILQRLLDLAGAAGLTPTLARAMREALPRAPAAAGSAPGPSGSGTGTETGAGSGTGTGGGAGGPQGAAGASEVPADAPLPPERVSQLAWLGLDAVTLERIAPYVTVLPNRTPVNLNTAPKEVLAAVLGVDLSSAERLVQVRQRTPFKSLEDARALLPQDATLDERHVAVNSSFFEVRGRLRLDERVLDERALVERRGRTVVTLYRERIAPGSAAR